MNNYIRAMHRTTRCRHLLFTEQAELTTELFYVRSQSDEFRVMNYEAMVCLVTASVANSVQGCLDTLLWGNDKSTLDYLNKKISVVSSLSSVKRDALHLAVLCLTITTVHTKAILLTLLSSGLKTDYKGQGTERRDAGICFSQNRRN